MIARQIHTHKPSIYQVKILIKRTPHMAQAKVRDSMMGSRHGEVSEDGYFSKCNLRGLLGKAKRRTEKAG